jgi:hypothetical protein
MFRAIASLAFLALNSFRQNTTAQLTGTVTGSPDAALPGAHHLSIWKDCFGVVVLEGLTVHADQVGAAATAGRRWSGGGA